MISVNEAKKIIEENISPLEPVEMLLENATGLVLAEDIFASYDIPAFPQSSMDGYAFSFNEWKQLGKLKIKGESAAGSENEVKLAPGSAVRIFTGAPLPNGADTVIMQEKSKVENGELIIEDEKLQSGNSVRPKGSEIKSGALALEKGNHLSAAAIGFLAGIGINKIKVFPNPSVCIIITGNELHQPGSPLKYGQVYESNSFALLSILKKLSIDGSKVLFAKDSLENVEATLQTALRNSDVVLLTGGISVGDYDFVFEAAEKLGVKKLFHKIKQRPGKPLYFGMKGSKLVFGLPGNPSSVLTCFYQYVLPSLAKLSRRKLELKKIESLLSKDFQKNTSFTHFLKGQYNGGSVTILDAQESYRLSSYATANCLVEIDEQVNSCKAGDLVPVYLLPD